ANATGHPGYLHFESEDVNVAFLPPNISSLIQPLDQGSIRTFKAYYTRRSMTHLVAAMDEDSHQEVIDYWKKFSIADCLSLIKEFVTELKAEMVNVGTRSKADGRTKHQVDDGGFKDLQELEVIGLIESHTTEVTDEELVGMTVSIDEEKDADEDSDTYEIEKLTLEGLWEILHTLKQVAEEIFKIDSDMVCAIEFKRDLEIVAEPYQQILDKMKKKNNFR
ncbi:Tigger transposable element-derived protein 1, partial [Trichinella papuae]